MAPRVGYVPGAPKRSQYPHAGCMGDARLGTSKWPNTGIALRMAQALLAQPPAPAKCARAMGLSLLHLGYVYGFK